MDDRGEVRISITVLFLLTVTPSLTLVGVDADRGLPFTMIFVNEIFVKGGQCVEPSLPAVTAIEFGAPPSPVAEIDELVVTSVAVPVTSEVDALATNLNRLPTLTGVSMCVSTPLAMMSTRYSGVLPEQSTLTAKPISP